MPAGNYFFVDTNVLLCAIDLANPKKRHAAQGWIDALWKAAAGRISWQVLHEFYVNAEKKLGMPRVAARKTVTMFATWKPGEVGFGAIERSWHWIDHAQVSYWDGLILASAEQAGCRWLLSEDFQEGREFGPIVVINPFSREPQELGLE